MGSNSFTDYNIPLFPGKSLISQGLIIALVFVLFIIAIVLLFLKKFNTIGLISVFVIIAIIFGPILLFGAFFQNQGQGNIEYTFTVTGLEGRNGNLVSDVIVPLPMQNGELLIPIDEIDGKTFGEWHTVIVGFPDSEEKMLALQHAGTNLTDINAEFYHYLPDGLIVDENNKVFLSPAQDNQESLTAAGRYAWSSKTSLEPFSYNYQSMISLPDNLGNKANSPQDEINFNILLRVNTGMTGFMTIPADYRFVINENISAGDSGFTPVNVDVHVS